MKPDLFYPTNEAWGTMSITNPAKAIENPLDDIAEPYYMGYIKYDDFPKCMLPTKVVYDSDNKKLTGIPLGEKTNIPWFFSTISSSIHNDYIGSDTIAYSPLYYKDDAWNMQSLYGSTISRPSFCFINSTQMCRLNSSNWFCVVYFTALISKENNSVTRTSEFPSYYSSGKRIWYTYSNLKDFFDGKSTLTIKAVNKDYELSISDLNDNGNFIVDYSEDDYLYVSIRDIYIDSVVNYGTTTDRGYYTPGFRVIFNDDYKIYYYLGQLGYLGLRGFYCTTSGSISALGYSGVSDNINIGGQAIFFMNSFPSISLVNGDNFENGVLTAKWDTSSMRIFPPVNPVEIWNVLSLYHKLSTATGHGYNDFPVYQASYTDDINVETFTDEDEPLYERISGNLATVVSKLRPWQIPGVDITANDFDVADMPEYDPGGDDDPPDIDGDNILPQLSRLFPASNGFITMYNITASHLEMLGKILWTSMYDKSATYDADFLYNFWIPVSEQLTGTLELSALMNYIISCRVYPFSVGTLPISTLAGNDVYMGTGVVGIPVGSNVRKLSSTIGTVHCGSVFVSPDSAYGDYRDYSETTLICYLPYCGTIELNPAEVMNTTLELYYVIDFYTGDCTAYLIVNNNGYTYPLAIKSGTIGVMIPISGNNTGQLIARQTRDGIAQTNIGLTALKNDINAAFSLYSGNMQGASNAVINMLMNANQEREIYADRQSRAGVQAPLIGGGAGAAAFAEPATAYIQFRRGTFSATKINNYGNSSGYPYTVSGKLSSYHGYTECVNVNVENLNCTDDEKEAIKSYLQAGVYLP